MKISTKKHFGWAGVSVGAGGMILFGILLTSIGPPSPPERPLIWLWPILTFTLMSISIFQLRRWYRNEPIVSEGLWHLHLIDLLSLSFFEGFLLFVCQTFWPGTFQSFAIPMVVTSTIALVVGLLVANRRGIGSTIIRFLFSLGWALRTFGALGVGAFVIYALIVIFVQFILNAQVSFVSLILSILGSDIRFVNDWLIYLFRASFASLLLGFYLLELTRKAQTRQLSQR